MAATLVGAPSQKIIVMETNFRGVSIALIILIAVFGGGVLAGHYFW